MIPEQIQSFPEAAGLEAHDRGILAGGNFDRGELTLEVARERIVDACEWLKARGYNLLSCVTCVDWWPAEPRFHVVYQLYSLSEHKRLRLKVKLPGDGARVPSVISVWTGANYYEREVWDLFGVHFDGHPDLRRIMMPDDWEGHPLRKDYPIEGIR